ncbi:O-antigen polymerase [Nocardioides perillae]|uniref:Oligosaccharide repeat unit polymerase n=1 Tax=Nocardioides perillae TaxID=1119534 RepID=A0A7Y9ULU6_9ACTN|nr:hypothetical protein [Nocardioides perillae]
MSATLGWLAAGTSMGEGRRCALSERRLHEHSIERAAMMVGVVALPVGLWSLTRAAYVPGISAGGVAIETSYQTVAILWPALVLLAFIYSRGMRPYLLIPFITYILLMGIQGHNRYRFLLPLLMLLIIYLDRKEWRWPRMWMVPVALCVVALFLPLKEVGRDIRSGNATASSVLDAISTSTLSARAGRNAEQALLDQGAISVMLAEHQDYLGLGRSYAALVTLPIPRPLWPDKPPLAGDLRAISTPSYPLIEVGAITTLVGELYIGFRWPGVVVGGFLFGTITGRFHRRAYSRERLSGLRFFHVLIFAVLLQVARDGLPSLLLFTVVNASPWVAIALLAGAINRRRAALQVSQRNP